MIPRPSFRSSGEAHVDLGRIRGFSVLADGALFEAALDVARLLEADLRRFAIELGKGPVASEGQTELVRLVADSSVASPEGYRLSVDASGVTIRASSRGGFFYGTRSLLALVAEGPVVPVTEIDDAPRYVWRGAHLDVGRHFFPVEFVERFIDLAALHKLNVFHWHLTEDQGWRIQIDAFPRLAEVAAYRAEGEQIYGGHYTKDEVRRVVAYAARRNVTVVPEIEMPGHALAALAAYPELSCTGGPFEVETKWGIFDDVYCAGNDRTLAFLETVLAEVCELFPSVYLHIGGDECPKKRWSACPRCQARIRAHGLAGEEELQSWFVSRMSRFLEGRGKRLVGWDEILEGGLAEGATVMSWRGVEGGIRAAKLGHDVVMSPTSHCYLDYKQADDDGEPGAWFAPALELERVYSYEPTPAELDEREAAHVLGVQGNVWTERMPTEGQVEYMTFPRLSALAEVAWSGRERDFKEFSARLERHFALLDRYDVRYRGSKRAQAIRPSAAEQEQYLQARRERMAVSRSSLRVSDVHHVSSQSPHD